MSDTLKKKKLVRETIGGGGVGVWCGWRERERTMKRKGGGTGLPRFMALTSVSFSTHCSQPVCHPPLLPLLSLSPPLVGYEGGGGGGGGGFMGQNRSFPWTLRCARHAGTHLGMKGRLMWGGREGGGHRYSANAT